MGRGCAEAYGLGFGRGSRRAPVRRCVPRFRPGAPSAACTFRPAPAFRATTAEFHLRVASAAPEPAMSGPNGDLGMPVDAGTEGENDSFGEAGDLGSGGVAEATFTLLGVRSEGLESGGDGGRGRD